MIYKVFMMYECMKMNIKYIYYIRDNWKFFLNIFNKKHYYEKNITRCGYTADVLWWIFFTNKYSNDISPYVHRHKHVQLYRRASFVEQYIIMGNFVVTCIETNQPMKIKFPDHAFTLLTLWDKNIRIHYMLQSYYYRYDFTNKQHSCCFLSNEQVEKMLHIINKLHYIKQRYEKAQLPLSDINQIFEQIKACKLDFSSFTHVDYMKHHMDFESEMRHKLRNSTMSDGVIIQYRCKQLK